MDIYIWLVACALFVLITSKRPMVGLLASMLLWLCLPNVASPLLTGSGQPFDLHPASWLTIVQFGAFLSLSRPQWRTGGKSKRFPWWFAAITLLMIFAVILNYSVQGFQSISLVVNLMLAPMVWFLMAMLTVRNDRGLLPRFVLTFLVAATINAVVALLQFASKSVIFYVDYYSNEYWFSTDLSRAIGLADSPVSLGMILVAAIPLLATFRRPSVRLSISIVFLLAAIATQSRVSVAMVAIGVFYVMFAGRFTVGRVVSLGAFVLAALVIMNGSLVNGLFARIQDDNNSAALRTEALEYFGGIWESVIISGFGAGTGVSLRTEGILESSLENGYLIYAYEFGIFFAVALLTVQVVLILRRPIRRNFGPGTFAASLVVINVFSFSSIGASGTMSFVMWFAILCAHSKLKTNEVSNRKLAVNLVAR